MKDKLIIASKYKKTIEYIHKMTDNYPHVELELKSRIINTSYDVLEYIYLVSLDKKEYKILLSKLKMLDYYFKISYKKELISKRKYEVVSNYLLETTKMVYGLINEKNK